MTYRILCVFHMAPSSKFPDFIHFQNVAVLTTLIIMHTKFLVRGPSAIIQLLWTNGYSALSLKHFETLKRLNTTEIFDSQYFTTIPKSVFYNNPKVSILQQYPSQYFTTISKSVFYNNPQVSTLQQYPSQYFTTIHKSVFYNKPQVNILQQSPSQYFTTIPKSVFYKNPHVSILQQSPSQYFTTIPSQYFTTNPNSSKLNVKHIYNMVSELNKSVRFCSSAVTWLALDSKNIPEMAGTTDTIYRYRDFTKQK